MYFPYNRKPQHVNSAMKDNDKELLPFVYRENGKLKQNRIIQYFNDNERGNAFI